MKRIIPFLLVLTACSTGNNNSAIDDKPTELSEIEITGDDENDQPNPAYFNEALKDLLTDPIDLQAYKKKYGGSNGGVRTGSKYLDIPDTVGNVYQYMLFYKLKNELPDHPSEGTLLTDFRITVFRFGEKIGRFSDTTEALLMIECAIDNPTLGDLNWYGMTKVAVMDIYGVPQFEQDDCLIYTYQQKTITAHLSNDRVDWYKYVCLNSEVKLEKAIPGMLLDF